MKELLVDAICGAGVPRVMTRGERAPASYECVGRAPDMEAPGTPRHAGRSAAALYEEIKDHYASK